MVVKYRNETSLSPPTHRISLNPQVPVKNQAESPRGTEGIASSISFAGPRKLLGSAACGVTVKFIMTHSEIFSIEVCLIAQRRGQISEGNSVRNTPAESSGMTSIIGRNLDILPAFAGAAARSLNCLLARESCFRDHLSISTRAHCASARH